MTTAPAPAESSPAEPAWYEQARRYLDEIDTFARIEWPGLSGVARTAVILGITAVLFAVLALVLGVGWGVATLLGVLLGFAARLGLGCWHWAQTTRPWDAADRALHVVTDPVSMYLSHHAASIPLSPHGLFTGWWVIGALTWIGAARSTGLTGRTVAWTVWACVTTATIWAGTAPDSRFTAAGIAALLLALASLPAYSSRPPVILPNPRPEPIQPPATDKPAPHTG